MCATTPNTFNEPPAIRGCKHYATIQRGCPGVDISSAYQKIKKKDGVDNTHCDTHPLGQPKTKFNSSLLKSSQFSNPSSPRDVTGELEMYDEEPQLGIAPPLLPRHCSRLSDDPARQSAVLEISMSPINTNGLDKRLISRRN
ncbi:hypothetical protein RUM43_009053 [Polyplax serrata]|uniref:Uncharacterized protein n=1 Tax=Polyplax serrata TaxID=468196 RepID=A0AAN8NPL4_POLSC